MHPAFVSITFYRAQDTKITDCVFANNGGSALLLIDVNGATIVDSFFTGSGHVVSNRFKSGGIILRRLLSTDGNYSYTITNCSFTNNVNLLKNSLCPNDGYFLEPQPNNIGYGGAIDIMLTTENSATNITIQNSHFDHNRALYGGAVCMGFSGINSEHVISFVQSTFESNMACTQGGAVSLRTNDDMEYFNESNWGHISFHQCSFSHNRAYWGGAVSVYRCRLCGDIIFSASDSTWMRNNAWSSGFAVAIGGNQTDTRQRNRFTIQKFHVNVNIMNCKFIDNTNSDYYQNTNAIGALALTSCDVNISGHSAFESNYGTSLLMKTFSRATITGDVTFRDNFGINGGAIHLVDGSYIRLNSTANVLFTRNHAVVRGGAIYSQQISETYGQPSVPCLLQLEDKYNPDNINVTFEGNIASNVDQALFISNPGQCNHTILMEMFTYMPPTPNQVQTSADTINFKTTPALVNNTLIVMLGERFFLNPTVADIYGQPSTSFGYLALLSVDEKEYSDSLNFTLVGPSSLGIDNYTQNNQFFIQGPDSTSEFILEFLFERASTYRSGSSQIKVEIVPCKIGYYYSPETKKCECVDYSSIICHETSVCIQQGYWYDEVGKMSVLCPTWNCDYINEECPGSTMECPTSPGYCNITSSDDVCREGRGKYLCSQCRDGYAFNFGAFLCVPDSTCKTQNTIFVMLGVMAYWLLFIAVLLGILTLQLQVGSGFMYGLVYYFSVLILFTNTTRNSPFLQAAADFSISMTQLDTRIVTEFLPICFARDMNALNHLMMRYVTPVFIISVIVAIILISRYCRCPKQISLAENSPIHAICLLILFSYTSLSHTSFQVLRPVVIGGTVYVQASPDTRYFHPKHHLPYALFALAIEIFITLPICILLTLAPFLSKFQCVNFVKLRLMPILDGFQACYRPKYRWFAGFYFLARQLMFLASIIPQQDLVQSNLALICISTVVLLIHTSFQPYKERWLNILDMVFLTDILLSSVYASTSATSIQVSGLNLIIYKAVPYFLILIPTSYLFIAVAVLLVKRPFNRLKGTMLYQRFRTSTESVVEMGKPDSPKSSPRDDLFGEREELLATHTVIPPPPWEE
jgi:predicted outer membrane repeat protein